MNIFWIFLLVPLCLDGIFSMVDNTSLTQQEQRKLGMQLNLMNGLAKKFEEQFSFTSSQKVYKDMNDIISKLNIYDAKAQMSLLKNIGGLIVSQNENIKNLVKFVNDLVPKMNVDKVDDQKSLLENLHNMVVSLSDDANVNNIKELLGKATNSYDELAQKTLNETRNSYLNSNSRNLPNSETIEELSNMITVHGSFDTNSDLVSVLRQLVESENEEDGSVQIQNDHENGPERNETLENAQKLYNKMAQNKLNEIKSRSFDEQQKLTLKDLDSLISKMENLQQTTQISLLETLSNLAQEENSRSIIYNRKFKQTSTSYNKSVEEKLGCLIKKYFISEGENKIYTPPDDMIFEHIESLISRINEPGVNDTILAILNQLNGLLPRDETRRNDLMGKVETFNNDAAMVQLKELSKKYGENSENVDDSVFQKLDHMIAEITYFDETTKQSFVEVLHQLAHAGKEDVKRTKQLMKKATTFIDKWIAGHLNRIEKKYYKTQTAILPNDEIFHQLDIMMSPHNELRTSRAIVLMLQSMKNLDRKTRLVRDKLLKKAINCYNGSATEKLDELLKKRSTELPHAIPSNDEIFGELDSLISDVNNINLNVRILALLDEIEKNCEDTEAEARHDRLVDKLITIINEWAMKEMDKIEKSYNEHKQSALLLPEDPIFNQLFSVMTDVIWPGIAQRVRNIVVDMGPLCISEESKQKRAIMMGQSIVSLNHAAQRGIRKIRREFEKKPNIRPDDAAFERLADMIEGMEYFRPDTIEQIFLALKSLTSTYVESLKKRDQLMERAHSSYRLYVENRLIRFRQRYGNKDFLESIGEMIFETNNLETNITLLKYLLEVECEEEEDRGTQNALIEKVKELEDQWVQYRFVLMVHDYLDHMSEQTLISDSETNEIDELISNLKYMLPNTQEYVIRVLIEITNMRQSNLCRFIRKWYGNCTIPELKEKYRGLIELQLRNSDSPLGVDNMGSQAVDSHHQASNNDLQDVNNGLQEERNLNYSQPMASPRFPPTEVGTPRETSGNNLELSAPSNPSVKNPDSERKD